MLKKSSIKFDKELCKRTVESNVKMLFRKTLEEANEQQIFQAVSYAIKQNCNSHVPQKSACVQVCTAPPPTH